MLALALAFPGPMHLGVDNAAAAGGIRAALREPCRVLPRPLLLVPNGDLWRHIHEELLRRPPGHVDVTQVEAHTQPGAIEDLWAPEPLRGRNAEADRTASAGATLRGAPAVQALACWRERAAAYLLPVAAVQRAQPAVLLTLKPILDGAAGDAPEATVGGRALRIPRLLSAPLPTPRREWASSWRSSTGSPRRMSGLRPR